MFFYYLFLSFVQAATEFLPVSSSGHLLFFKGLFQQSEIPVFFDIILHLGSLAAIIYFYRKKLLRTAKDAIEEIKISSPEKSAVKFIFYIIISTIVTFICYLLFKDSIESQFDVPQILKYTFIITSILLYVTKYIKPGNKINISSSKFFIPVIAGLFQAAAILPGISRSGSTIAILMLMKIDKEVAAFYSFSLAIPAILGAFLFKLGEIDNLSYLSENWLLLSLSLICSAVFSYLFLKLLTYVITKQKFWLFSIYTLLMAVLSIVIF